MPALPHVYRRAGSACRLLDACITNIGTRESTTRAWVSLDLDAARRAALELDQEADAGRYRGPLHGMPVGIKDLFDVAGMPTRAGSVSRAAIGAASDDAPIIASLRAAGCIVLGKTKTTEYAWLDPTDATNPFAVTRTPGGSSSGSGAAVGAGMVPLALGTQTVGSVCRPAAYCGTAAFKPTTGSLSMQGVVPFAPSYDTPGFLAPTLSIAVDAWRAAAGVKDPTSEVTVEGLAFGLPNDDFFSRIDPDIATTLEQIGQWLEAAGATRVALALSPDLEAMRALQRTVMFHEAAREHSRLLADEAMFARLGTHWRECLSIGKTITGDAAESARQALARISEQALSRLQGLDLVLVPAASSVAPPLATTGDPGLILPWTVFGTPLTVLPVGQNTDRLPTAVMLAGQPSADARHAMCSLAVERLVLEQGGGFRGPRLL